VNGCDAEPTQNLESARALLGTAAGQERDLALPSGKRTFASRRCSNLDQKISDQLDKLGTHAGSPGGTLPRLSSAPSPDNVWAATAMVNPKSGYQLGIHSISPKLFGYLNHPSDRLCDLMCTRQGSNLQPCDPKSHTLG